MVMLGLAKMYWRKQERYPFIPVTWIGERNGVDVFVVSMNVSPPFTTEPAPLFSLFRKGTGTVAYFNNLAECKAHAETLA
jgi:hypothetical protein